MVPLRRRPLDRKQGRLQINNTNKTPSHRASTPQRRQKPYLSQSRCGQPRSKRRIRVIGSQRPEPDHRCSSRVLPVSVGQYPSPAAARDSSTHLRSRREPAERCPHLPLLTKFVAVRCRGSENNQTVAGKCQPSNTPAICPSDARGERRAVLGHQLDDGIESLVGISRSEEHTSE